MADEMEEKENPGAVVVFLILAIITILLATAVVKNIDWQKFEASFPLSTSAGSAGR